MTDVLSHEYSEEFDCLRKNRVEVAYYKYGAARIAFGSGRVDALTTAGWPPKHSRKTTTPSIFLMLQII